MEKISVSNRKVINAAINRLKQNYINTPMFDSLRRKDISDAIGELKKQRNSNIQFMNLSPEYRKGFLEELSEFKIRYPNAKQ